MWDAPWHWVVLAIVVIALFGYKRLPDAARSLGRSMRIFKTEVKGMSEDDKKRAGAKSADKAEQADAAGATAVPKAIEAGRSEPNGGLSHTAPETAPAEAPPARPRPTPAGSRPAGDATSGPQQRAAG